jgi:methyl-accepting chemotaxis protein
VPLGECVEAARRLSEGNLAVDISVRGDNETALLLEEMQNMVLRWRAIVHEVKEAADQMTGESRQLSIHAGQMRNGSSQQAAKSSQVASSAEEMAQTIVDIARNTSDIAASASTAVSIARSGADVVSDPLRR